ncbi:hypothetical protein AMS68_000677 [Peltaster fructicola]|uniref:tRNA(adenine(34)) deaminase n=1 Tax=Peltaster fructicola TaxID=286661 RepID=A0A6H0XKX7_9PEZI|nr:hypothetical protein AMS68_000677 [Peltaster fructicola]
MSRKDKAKARKYAKKAAEEATTTSTAASPPAYTFSCFDLSDENAQKYLSETFAASLAWEQPAITAIGSVNTTHLNFSRLEGSHEMVFGPVPDREYHEGFMRKAIEMAEMALRSDETPVGCVFVHNGEIIGRGINGTNATLNGTRHAEFVALAEIMSTHPQSILKETDLYVTVEPCIMCASALRQYGVRTVYFGCLNDRFGGTGGVMTVNQDPGVDPPFNVYGGLFREEAIMLLRRFYVQENEKAPEPKPKKNRELKTAILPVNAPVTRVQGASAIARALAAAKVEAAAET